MSAPRAASWSSAAGSVELPFAMHIMSSTGPSVGLDHGSAVSERYTGPNPFTGSFHRLEVQLLEPGAARPSEAVVDERASMARQ